MRFRSFSGIIRPARGGRRTLIKEGGMAKRDSAPQRARQSVARWTVALVFGFLSLAFATALPAAAQSDTVPADPAPKANRPEEHTSELQSLMRNSYAVF